MPEFMFRNLSVKLYPAAGETGQACGDGTSQPAVFHNNPYLAATRCYDGCSIQAGSLRTVFCGPDSNIQYCAQASGILCDAPSLPACDPVCDPATTRAYVDPQTKVVLPANADVREELATLKADLQRKMAAVEARQQEVENAAKPTSVEQIDDLKSQLLAAVAELDDQRGRLEGGGQAPPAS